jgi:hypothetical protein
MHIEIKAGGEIVPLTPWFRHDGSPKAFREARINQYLDNIRKGRDIVAEPPPYGEKIVCQVPTNDGGIEFLRQKTVKGWQTSFPNLNIHEELEQWLICWIKKNDNWQPNGKWVHQIRGMLKKKNDAARSSDVPWD